MARRPNYVYTGMYTDKHRVRSRHETSDILGPELTRLAKKYFRSANFSVNYNYVALLTVCLVVLLSYMLPNISDKIHRTTELKAMKKILDVMTIPVISDAMSSMQKEISRAEIACLTVANQLGSLRGSMHDGTTETLPNQQDLAVCTSDSMRTTQSAPVPVEKKMGFFRRIFFPYKNTENKEIAIMSYLYTDSFDKIKKAEANPAEPRNI